MNGNDQRTGGHWRDDVLEMRVIKMVFPQQARKFPGKSPGGRITCQWQEARTRMWEGSFQGFPIPAGKTDLEIGMVQQLCINTLNKTPAALEASVKHMRINKILFFIGADILKC